MGIGTGETGCFSAFFLRLIRWRTITDIANSSDMEAITDTATPTSAMYEEILSARGSSSFLVVPILPDTLGGGVIVGSATVDEIMGHVGEGKLESDVSGGIKRVLPISFKCGEAALGVISSPGKCDTTMS